MHICIGKVGYIDVGMPLEARCFRMSLSVPYQLKPLVEWPIRGRWTLAIEKKSWLANDRTNKPLLLYITLIPSNFFYFKMQCDII